MRGGATLQLHAEPAGQEPAHEQDIHARTSDTRRRQPLLRQHRQRRHSRGQDARLPDDNNRHARRCRQRARGHSVAALAQGRRHSHRIVGRECRLSRRDTPHHADGSDRPSFRRYYTALRMLRQPAGGIRRHLAPDRHGTPQHTLHTGRQTLHALAAAATTPPCARRDST